MTDPKSNSKKAIPKKSKYQQEYEDRKKLIALGRASAPVKIDPLALLTEEPVWDIDPELKKKTVVLLRPFNVYHYYNYIPLGLVCIGSALEKHGYNVIILDAGWDPNFQEKMEAAVKDALFVGIGLMTSEIPHTLEILSRVREIAPQTPTVVGGWHVSLFPEQMSESDLVDWVVIQEGENAVVHIANTIASGMKCPEIPNKKIIPREILKMEELPHPNYKISLNHEDYITSYLTDSLTAHVKQPMRWLPYDSSRGCPSQCTFCINVVAGNMRYRTKSAEKCVEEIVSLVEEFNLTHVKIIDDNFFVNIRRVRAILEGIIEAGLEVTIDAECRTNYFNEKMINDATLALMKRAGIVQLTLGIESGSPDTLVLMKKGATVEHAENAVRQCNKHGIIARSSFILECPGEKKSDIEETIQFINRMREYPLFSAGVGTFRPYPKCEMTTSIMERGLLKEPESLAEWALEENIRMWTSSEEERPWQVDPEFSAAAAHYINIESETRISLDKLSTQAEKDILGLIIEIAKVRNRNMDYAKGGDLDIYKKFTTDFYRNRSQTDAGSKYPLPDPHHEDK